MRRHVLQQIPWVSNDKAIFYPLNIGSCSLFECLILWDNSCDTCQQKFPYQAWHQSLCCHFKFVKCLWCHFGMLFLFSEAKLLERRLVIRSSWQPENYDAYSYTCLFAFVIMHVLDIHGSRYFAANFICCAGSGPNYMICALCLMVVGCPYHPRFVRVMGMPFSAWERYEKRFVGHRYI